MVLHVHDLRARPERKILDVERRLWGRRVHDFPYEVQRPPSARHALALRPFEVEEEIEGWLVVRPRRGYDVNVRHRQLLRLETIIDRLDGQAAIVLDTQESLLGHVGHDLAISHQRRAAIVADVDAQNLHERTS